MTPSAHIISEDSTILIVDDNPRNIQLLASILKPSGYNVVFAFNGQKALELSLEREFSVVLLDVMMPGIDGFEVCRRLKSNPQTAHIPVIFLTAKTDSESVTKGFQLGAVDYISKPFNRNELLSRVNTHLTINNQHLALEKASAFKDKVFSIISHDLKGPLGNLAGFLEMIKSNYKSPKINIERSLNLAIKTATASFNMLENLLIWARSQQGKITYNPTISDLSFIAEDVQNLLNGNAKEKEIDLQISIPPKTMAFFDSDLLNIVVRNLVANAIKFTYPQGVIYVWVESREYDITLYVEDNGEGISAENIEKITNINTFYSTFGTQDETGSGLGLKLCIEFLRLHNSQLHIESTPGKGSKFSFNLLTQDILGQAQNMA